MNFLDYKDQPFKVFDLKNYNDERGNLFEAIRFKSHAVPSEGQIYIYSINPGFRRGDHYHSKKYEWIFLTSGSVDLLLYSDKTNKSVFHLSSEHPQLVFIGLNTVHTLVNASNSPASVVAYASSELDKSNPDTHPFLISPFS